MRLRIAWTLLLLVGVGTSLVHAQSPAGVLLRIDKVDVADGEEGVTFEIALTSGAPAGTVLRTTLLFDQGMVAWNIVPKEKPEDGLTSSWGPFAGLVPGVYVIRLEISAQDQDAALLGAHPGLEKSTPVSCEVRVGDAETEKVERERYRALYVATAREFHDLWIGIWHRTETAVQTLFFLKHSKPPRLTDEKKSAVQAPWLEFVEGEYLRRLTAATTALEAVVNARISAYVPDARNELINHAALLRRARSGAWRRMGPLIGREAPADTKRDPSLPPPSLVRNVTESYERLAKSLGEDLGILAFPEFPSSPEIVEDATLDGRRVLTWKSLGTAVTVPPGWTADPMPGNAPFLALLKSPDGHREAELSLLLYPKLAGEAALRHRIEMDARRGKADVKDLSPLDPGVTAAGSRTFHSYSATVVVDGRTKRSYWICELFPAEGIAHSLRFHGPEATEEEFRAWRASVSWPAGTTGVDPSPAGNGSGK